MLNAAEAVAAVNRSTVSRFERNLGLSATLSADSRIHLSRCIGCCSTDSLLFGSSAGGASLRIIGETLLGIEFLLCSSESEFGSTISTS
jgi:hypothetical protein